MIISTDINPKLMLYYIGSLIMDILNKHNKFKLIKLYYKIRENNDMSFPIFIYSLNWLYLINLVDFNKKSKLSMYVKNLKIYKSDSVIRDVNFKMGFNFIVDEISGNILQETGNNVGKTTVLKLINFCLGGKADEIYTDPENKNKKYNLIKDYLEDNDVFVSLTLTNDLQNNDKTILIERNFLSGKNKVIKINKEIIFNKDKEFEMHLKKLIFPNLKSEKPTFRQIISQNIRYNEKRVNNTLKVLSNYATDLEYETLFLFLLGCDINKMQNKEKLNVKLRDEMNFKKN